MGFVAQGLHPIVRMGHFGICKPLFFLVSAAVILLFFLPLHGVYAQRIPCPGLNSYPVDIHYRPDANGDYCAISNEENGKFNFASRTMGSRYPLADPSLMVLDGRYFVVGTSDDAQNANYVIYTSRDLADWRVHGRVFNEKNRRLLPTSGEPNRLQHAIEISPGRFFCDLWAAQIYQDPSQPQNVFVTFTAVEDGPLQLCRHPNWWYRTQGNSVYRATISKDAFLAGKGFADVQAYGYTLNNQPVLQNRSNLLYDGGFAAGRSIPVTSSLSSIGPNSNQFFNRSGRPCSHRMGCNVAMGIDSGVYFDLNDSNKPWILYTWFDLEPGHLFHGMQVAGTSLLSDHYRMDASASAELLPFAFKRNSTSKNRLSLNGRLIDNGLMGPDGPFFDHVFQYSEMPNSFGIAEGPGLFHYNGRPYFYVSRNHFESSAYGIFYRMGAPGQKVHELALRNWADHKQQEYPLLVSSDRVSPRGVSFGHGEIFMGPENRPYLIFHKKEAGSYERTPYLKELTSLPDGRWLPLTDDPSVDPKQWIGKFLIPRPR